MRKSLLLSSVIMLFFGCSKQDDRVIVKETWNNGQPEVVIYKTIDDKNTYYEIRFDSLGRIMNITPYSEGKLNGTQISFSGKSGLGVGALLPFIDGKKEGFVYEFYEGQQTVFKGKFKEDKFNGVTTLFYENGNILSTGITTNDMREGEWTEYYENGEIKAKGTYKNGEKQLDWIYLNIDGTPDTTQKEH